MVKKNLIIFDGNKKFHLGGGQVVTLNVLEQLKEEFDIYLIETEKSPEFFSRASLICQKNLRLTNFELLNIFLILIFIFRHQLYPSRTICYSAAKKSHLYCIFFRIFNYKTVIHIHSLNPQFSLKNILMKFAFLFSNRIIVPSQYVNQVINNQKNMIIYNSTPILEFKIKNHIKDKIVFVGSIEKIKGVEDFCKIANDFYPKYNFEVWGEGSLRIKLQAQFPNVRFIGFVSQIPQKLNKEAKILVLPSLIPETFGLVLIEAFSAGVPVITSNIGAQNEIVELIQGKYTFSPGNLEEFKSKLSQLLIEDNYNNACSNIKLWENYFNLENFKKQLLKVLNF